MDDETDSPHPPPKTEDFLVSSDIKFLDPDRRYIRRYAMREPIGYALLMGSDKCTGKRGSLKCVYKDVKLMEKVLVGRKWIVDCPCVEEGKANMSLTREKYDQVMNSLRSNPTLEEISCFLFYYSGHGTPEGIALCGDELVTYKEIVDTIDTLKALNGKPKVVIFDSCRNWEDDGDSDSIDSDFEQKGLSGSKLQSFDEQILELSGVNPPPDSVICFSASEGKASFADSTAGSIFTIQLAHALREFGDELSFCDIMTQVRGGTVKMAHAAWKERQQPVCLNALNYQLVISSK